MKYLFAIGLGVSVLSLALYLLVWILSGEFTQIWFPIIGILIFGGLFVTSMALEDPKEEKPKKANFTFKDL